MLTLPIKRKWFDMILVREKPEEYRTYNRYYTQRFGGSLYKEMRVRFRNGYGKGRPTLECLVVPALGYGRPEWGGDPRRICFVLHIKAVELVEQ